MSAQNKRHGRTAKNARLARLAERTAKLAERTAKLAATEEETPDE